jgi:hypothetical protein
VTPAIQNRNANLSEMINRGWKKPLQEKKVEQAKKHTHPVKDIDNSHLLK